MAEYKVGDRVKILISYFGFHKEGDIGTINEYEYSAVMGTELYLVEKDTTSESWWYCDFQIELVSLPSITIPAIYLYRALHHPYIRSH